MKGDSVNTVEAYVFGGDGRTVCFSPFSTKLLMYLRLTGIPHTTSTADVQKAPKSKVPYIHHGKNMLGDSQLIIRYLENSYEIKTSSSGVVEKYGLGQAFVPFTSLSPTQQAKVDAIRSICENDLYWAVMSCRWGGAAGMLKSEDYWSTTVTKLFPDIPAIIRSPIVRFIRTSVLRDAYGQGFCRHSAADQTYLAKRAIAALSVMLGNGPYFLGKAPSECDCIAFGTIDQLLADSWPSELEVFIRQEVPNLVEYWDRLRSSIFSDLQIGQRIPEGVQ